MLEVALSLGDLALARKTREMAREHGQFPDEDMPRWHELNLILALAGHETDLANEHAYKLLELAEKHSDDRVRQRAMAAVNNQAVLLQETAHYSLAEPLLRRSLELNEKNFGPDHPAVASCLNNLAQLLQDTNRMAEAEPLMRRALAIIEKGLGQEHPDVATCLNNLATLLEDNARLMEAEPLMCRALAIGEKSLGPEHPDIGIWLNNLAGLLRNTNRLAEAEPLARRAACIMLHSLGDEHPNTTTAINNYTHILSDMKLPRSEIEARLRGLTGQSHPIIL